MRKMSFQISPDAEVTAHTVQCEINHQSSECTEEQTKCNVCGSQKDLTQRMCVLSCLGVNRFSYYWVLCVLLEIWSCRVYSWLLKLVWIAETMCSYLAQVTAWSFQWGFYAPALAELYLDELPKQPAAFHQNSYPLHYDLMFLAKILWMNPTQITWPLGHLISWV